MCNNVNAMPHFYTELLGMPEDDFFIQESFGYLSYKCEGVWLMFFYSGKETPKHTEWARQPSYDGGTLHVTSWAIEIPEANFANTAERLKKEGLKTFSEVPEWRQDTHSGFSVMDPQGNTVEVYAKPKAKPTSTTWSGK